MIVLYFHFLFNGFIFPLRIYFGSFVTEESVVQFSEFSRFPVISLLTFSFMSLWSENTFCMSSAFKNVVKFVLWSRISTNHGIP